MQEVEDYEYELAWPKSNIGWFDIKLPPTAITRLNEYLDGQQKENHKIKYNSTITDPKPDASPSLAGHISASYYLKDVDDWFFKNYLEFMSFDYLKHFDHQPAAALGMKNYDKHPFQLDSLWVNYQNKHEFNPSHDHTGAFSFVIFMKIPTHWKEQHNLPFVAQSNQPRASDFAFEYLTPLGEKACTAFKMGPESEGRMLFFPAKLTHLVYPFYNCDEPRITIAGNISYNTDVGRTSEEIKVQMLNNGEEHYR